MKKIILIRPLALVSGAFLVLPSLYFIVSAWLNYGMGWPALWKVIEPVFDKPENKTFGFNINVLILFGPLVAILINLPQVVHLHFSKSDEEVYVYLSASRFKYSWLIIAAGTFCLGTLFFYLIAENCLC
ncbi:MAG: hypothetical protein JWQ09_2677 [Segetibacter sp.]|nr:hypothetical protein [Segetibacter sp.]